MSETIFRKVMCSDRLPEKEGWYFGGTDEKIDDETYKFTKNTFVTRPYCDTLPKWWLEEIELPSEEVIEKMAHKNGCRGVEAGWFIEGFKKAINLITNGK